MTDGLKDLLDLLDEAGVVDRFSELYVSKMTRTFVHALLAGGALELTIDRSKARIIETIDTRLLARLVHRFGIHDMSDTHILDLFW